MQQTKRIETEAGNGHQQTLTAIEAIASSGHRPESLAEVAQVMDKSEAAVKMLVYRGLQELRDRFGPVAVEDL